MESKNLGVGRGTLKNYCIGFIASIILTLLAFVVVMFFSMNHSTIFIIIIMLAIIQMIVHFIYFLHLKPGSHHSWNWLAFMYTLILLGILIGASIWIMYHLNQNMIMDPTEFMPSL